MWWGSCVAHFLDVVFGGEYCDAVSVWYRILRQSVVEVEATCRKVVKSRWQDSVGPPVLLFCVSIYIPKFDEVFSFMEIVGDPSFDYWLWSILLHCGSTHQKTITERWFGFFMFSHTCTWTVIVCYFVVNCVAFRAPVDKCWVSIWSLSDRVRMVPLVLEFLCA